MPLWRNWYTHSTQNAARNHVGSSPTNGTTIRVLLNDKRIKSTETGRFFYVFL